MNDQDDLTAQYNYVTTTTTNTNREAVNNHNCFNECIKLKCQQLFQMSLKSKRNYNSINQQQYFDTRNLKMTCACKSGEVPKIYLLTESFDLVPYFQSAYTLYRPTL